jgi:hypothetical protein
VSCHWRIDGNAIVFTTDDGTWRLHLRQHEGHVYLVPRAHLDWFDANGPYEELCFSSDGAPLLSYPPYMAADAVNSSWRHGVTTSGPGVDPRAVQVSVGDDELSVELADGRRLSVPLVWFPRLLHADAAQRRNWRLLGDGQGISWPDLHEDLSVEGLLRGCVGPGASWRAI